MPIKLNKLTIDFNKVKKQTEKILDFDVSISSSETEYTIIAPDGYELIHPVTLQRVKRLTLTNDIPILDIWLLSDLGTALLTDTNEKIDFIE